MIFEPPHGKTICENKGADQLRSNCEADQHLCFGNTDSTISLLLKSEISSFCGCTDRFVSDLVGIPEDRFSRVAAHSNLDITDESIHILVLL